MGGRASFGLRPRSIMVLRHRPFIARPSLRKPVEREFQNIFSEPNELIREFKEETDFEKKSTTAVVERDLLLDYDPATYKGDRSSSKSL
jgi:hypothetical protein